MVITFFKHLGLFVAPFLDRRDSPFFIILPFFIVCYAVYLFKYFIELRRS